MAVNLAHSMALLGRTVGVLDADVYGTDLFWDEESTLLQMLTIEFSCDY